MSEPQALPTTQDLKAVVAALAARDATFRTALLADPRAAIEQLFGCALPPNVKIQAVAEPADTYIVVVPHVTSVGADGELSDDDLEAVAGGSKAGAKTFFSQFAAVSAQVGSTTAGALAGSVYDTAKAWVDGQAGPGVDQVVNRVLRRC